MKHMFLDPAFNFQMLAPLTDSMLDNFACFLTSADYFLKLTFQQILITSEYQTVWIQIRLNTLLGLIWDPTFANFIS